MPLEIERKYLLKDIPSRRPDQRLEIKQFYCEDKKRKLNYRIRKITHVEIDTKPFGSNTIRKVIKVEYVQTIKTRIRPGVYEEHECVLNEGAFKHLMMYAKTSIFKTRFVYKINKKLKWEVDAFSDMKLVLAEIEIPKMSFKFKIPKYIKEVLLMEVTKFEQFTNKALSKKI